MPMLTLDASIVALGDEAALHAARRVLAREAPWTDLASNHPLYRNAQRIIQAGSSPRHTARVSVNPPPQSSPPAQHSSAHTHAPIAPQHTDDELLEMTECKTMCRYNFRNLVVMSCCKSQMCMVCLGGWITRPRDDDKLDDQALSNTARMVCPGCKFPITHNIRTCKPVEAIADLLVARGHNDILHGERDLSEAAKQYATFTISSLSSVEESIKQRGIKWLHDAEVIRKKKMEGQNVKRAISALENRKVALRDLFGDSLYIDFGELRSDDGDFTPEEEEGY